MAAFPCPYCGHALTSGADASAKLERCPSCDGNLLIAYRYRLVEAHKKISGGQLYLALDDGFDEKVAVLFVDDAKDTAAVERFLDGSSLFADFGGRGLVKVRELGTPSDRRPYVVMDWLEGGTLDQVVKARGPIPQAALHELISDLLTGLSKAHRSMPSVVHGHIHPGKIGFNKHKHAVLFGFEWATQFNSQTSRLADSFVTEAESKDTRSPASDVRQLGSSFYYAASGEWIGDKTVAVQRARVREQLPGPLGSLVDRMLGAGVDGYRSAVYAAIDYEQLMRGGVDRWTPTAAAALDRSEEHIGAAWTPVSASPFSTPPKAADDDDDEDEDEDEEDEEAEQHQVEFEAALARGRQPHSSAPAGVNWAQVNATRQAEALRQAVAHATPTPTANPGRTIAIAIGAMLVVGTCVAGIIADEADSPAPPAQFRGVEPARQQVEPIPQPDPRFEPSPEPVPPVEAVDPPTPEPAVAGVLKYEGKITGPTSFAGLALDQTCEVWVEPNVGGLNCRWYIDCGKPRRRIYGGGTAGYSTCTVDETGRVVFAQDEEDDASDGAFLANLNATDPMIVVLDRWLQPPVHVIISVDAGTFGLGPIPDVPLAPRVADDAIQAQIDEGVFPTIEPGKLADW